MSSSKYVGGVEIKNSIYPSAQMNDKKIMPLYNKRRFAVIGFVFAIAINIATEYSAGMDKTFFFYIYAPMALLSEIIERLIHLKSWWFTISLLWVGLYTAT